MGVIRLASNLSFSDARDLMLATPGAFFTRIDMYRFEPPVDLRPGSDYVIYMYIHICKLIDTCVCLLALYFRMWWWGAES